MASRYWVGGTGNWSDNTNHWSASSGGAAGASKPTTGDAAILDGSSGGGTVTADENIVCDSISMGSFNGTLDSSSYNVTLQTFSISGAATRTLTMGSGTWTLTGSNTTIWNTGSAAGLTLNKGNPIVCNYSGSTGTRNISANQNSETLALDFNITAGTDILRISSGRNLDFTGFSGSFLGSVNFSFYGNITFSSSMTYSGAATLTFAATSGTKTITTNGMTFDANLTINGTGGTLQMGDNLTIGSTKRLTITNGTFSVSASNYALSTGLLTLTSGGTLTLGSATHSITGTGTTTWNVTGGTLTAFTGTLKFTDTVTATGITFAGGSKTYNNVWFARGSNTQSHTITGSNTFADFKDDGSAAHSILFTAGTTQTVSTFTVSGSAGNLITINSTSTATHALVKSGGGTISCDYLNIQHSVATPSSTWYAGTNSVDNQAVATSGSGWTFSAPPAPSTRRVFIIT